MLINLIETGKPLVVLQTGYISLSRLEIHLKQKKLQLQPLFIPGYAGLTKDHCIRLLLMNMDDCHADYYRALIPAKYKDIPEDPSSLTE